MISHVQGSFKRGEDEGLTGVLRSEDRLLVFTSDMKRFPPPRNKDVIVTKTRTTSVGCG